MRLLPRSLFGRLLLLLIAGLVLAQVLTGALLYQDRGRVLHRAVGENAAQRIAAIVTYLDSLPPRERRRLATALDLPPTRIRLHEPWRRAAPSPEADRFAALLRSYLPDRRIQVAVRTLEPPPAMPPEHRWMHRRHGGIQGYRVQVALGDGRPVTFRHRLPDELFHRPWRLLVTLTLVLVTLLAVAVLAARWLTRPLRRLTEAAAALGRDIRRPPLTEAGPLEVSRAARAFNTMQTRLQRYIQDRGRVLAAVSHDLKTPVTRLRLRAELLEDEALKERFQADLDEMEAMVQATLDFMRGTEQAETPVPLDLGALLDSLGEDFRETGGQVTVNGKAIPYPGRPLALKRLFANLLDNALKYGRQARVELTDGPEALTVTIRDDGSGIPEGELERVFEPFHRLEGSRSRATGGTGLGLGIARNIARAHGGDVVLRNRAPGGLEAVVSLPR